MTIALIIIGFVVAGLYAIYASLIRKKNNVKEAAAGIDVQLKKRYDLVPNMLKAAAKYMEHEKAVFEKVTELRQAAMNAASYVEKFKADANLTEALRSFRIQAEAYPELKSDAAMVSAQQAMAETEEHIAAARRFYNSAVKDYKNALEIFPSSMVAAMIGLKDIYPFFEASETEKQAVDVNEYFK
ncbi:MAG: LemA family protein [Acetobacter sp.]|nr:LemA family protein [Acetobacter sp.]